MRNPHKKNKRWFRFAFCWLVIDQSISNRWVDCLL